MALQLALRHLLGRCYLAHVLACSIVVAVSLGSVGVTPGLPLVCVLCMLIFWAAFSNPVKLADIEGTTTQRADMGSIGKMNTQCVEHPWTPPPSARLDEGCSIVVWCSIRQRVWPPGLDILRFSNEAAEIFGGSFQGLPLELLLHGSSVSAIWHAIADVINEVNSRKEKEVNSRKEKEELCQCAKVNLDGVRLLSWNGSFTANLSILCVKESEGGAEIICLGIKRNLDVVCTVNESQTTRSEGKTTRQHLKAGLAQKTALRSASQHSSWKADCERRVSECHLEETHSSRRSSSVPPGCKFGKQRKRVRFSLRESQ